MKATRCFTAFSLFLRLAKCDVVPLFDLSNSFTNNLNAPFGNWSAIDGELGSNTAFAKRQTGQCVDAGYVPCPNVAGKCCPAGDTCFPTFCCPTGTQPCEGSRFCYNPSTEKCCANGTCPKADSCCEQQCCKSVGYCAANGFCSACPDATIMTTTTRDTTTTSTITTTTTKVKEPEEAPEFRCVPMTVTNGEGGTLALDTECGLSYTPPQPSGNGDSGSSAQNSPGATLATPTPLLRPRQLGCTPYRTDFSTLTSTRTVTTRTTTTTTVTTEPPNFSCVPMSVTNPAGDELALDDKCKLEFSPATPNSTAAATSQRSVAARLEGSAISIFGLVVASIVAFSIL